MTTNEQILPHVRLQFHINHPSLDDCWIEGYEASNNNLAEQDNPFEMNTKEYEYWHQGWWAGFYGEEPLFSREDLDLSSQQKTAQVIDIRKVQAANQPDWSGSSVKKWAGRVVKIAGAIAVTVAAIELIDMAV